MHVPFSGGAATAGLCDTHAGGTERKAAAFVSNQTRTQRRKTKCVQLRFLILASCVFVAIPLVFVALVLGDAKSIPEKADVRKTARANKKQISPDCWARPAWNVSLEMDRARMKIKAGTVFFAKSIDELTQQVPNITKLNKSCHFAYPLKRHITLFEYASKSARGKYGRTPVTFFDALQQEAEGRVVRFSESLPRIVKQTPVVFSPFFDIGKGFGLWGSFFLGHLPAKTGDQADVGSHGVDWCLPLEGGYSGSQVFGPQPPLYAAVFPNAVVSNSHVITCNGNVYTSGGCLRRWYLPKIQRTKEIDWRGVVVGLCDEWCKGYYHFTHEHLPRLALVHKILLEREDAILALYAPIKKFQLQWLTDVLGIPSYRILRKPGPVHGHLVLYPIPGGCGTLFTHLTYALRDIVFERLQLVPPIPSKKRKLRLLFAERERLSRMPSNYHQLKKMLLEEYKKFFDFGVFSGKLHMRQQVRYFYDADVVIGPHGSNLANAMWMRHGTHLIEFVSYKYANMCYHTTANTINVTYHAIFHNAEKEGSYVLSYDEVKRHMDHAVEKLLKSP
ncbi:hypothetical protein TCSYLVIO_005712 [Trypanosoma cruzi]|uniref:Glycosyltransferase 61 catalytic domain-containing protein n=1 Tax=Trypanosoma cruzi Dm28c TaxID=1416333 RepID=V5BXT4_TRYCR|nr:hypothetical protein TCSYLVIO_005712 [Trypanosoma cruzi]ESS71022.1 hypothetical protein TCDM_00019 [Trypanosoma cruzi Dm28c]